MKKTVCVLMAFALLLAMAGCAPHHPTGNTAEPEVTDEAKIEAGLLQTTKLRTDPANYDRSMYTGYGSFQESETGYYCIQYKNNGSFLYYADKTDLNNWVVVCPDPTCSHSSYSDCIAQMEGVFMKDNRLYFLAEGHKYSYLCPEYKAGTIAKILCSAAPNCSDLRAEHVYEDALLSDDGGVCSARLLPGGYTLCMLRMNPDGSYRTNLYLYDLVNGETELLQMDDVDGQNSTQVLVYTAGRYAIRGDNAVMPAMIDGTIDNYLCWVIDGTPVTANLSQLPVFGGYLAGSVLRYFKPGDGYYDIDLLTGAQTRLADAQLQYSNARILLPNCIIESTLQWNNQDPNISETRARVEKHALRFFDGIAWHDVALPVEILNLPDSEYLDVEAVASDCIIFTANINGAVAFYRIVLESENYALEYCGSFR